MDRIAPPAALGNTDGRRFLSRRRRGCACPPAGVCSKKQPAPSSPLAKHSSVSVPVASPSGAPVRSAAAADHWQRADRRRARRPRSDRRRARRRRAQRLARLRSLTPVCARFPCHPCSAPVRSAATRHAAPRRAARQTELLRAVHRCTLGWRRDCCARWAAGTCMLLYPSTAGHFRRRVGMIIRARWRMVRHAASAMSVRESEAMRLSRLDEWLKAQSSLHSEAPQPWPAPPFTHPLPHARTHARTHSRRGRNPLLHGHTETSGQILLRLGRCIFSISSARSRRSGRLSIVRRRRCAVCEPCMHGV